jgi:hypothetical protein
MTCTFEYAAPMNGGQYNDVLANDTYLVAIVKTLYYMIFGWWSFGLICIKTNFTLYFPNENIFNHLKTLRVKITPR